ncbi:MAG: AAA family ATPase [Archaeoglobaceae archaeon]
MTVVAVTGKGGTGKTVVSALLVNYFSRNKRVLAVDADPDSNLPETLGISGHRTLGGVREIFQEKKDEFGTMSKEAWVEGKIYGEAIYEADDFDLLVMGQPEGEGCYCFVNNLLKGVLKRLLTNYDVVVIDCEAGLEHFSRKTIEGADYILVVTDSSRKGIATAKRIKDSSHDLDLNFNQIYLLGNRVNSNKEIMIKDFAGQEDMSFLGVIPYLEEIEELEYNGEPVIRLLEDNKFNKQIEELFAFIGDQNDH